MPQVLAPQVGVECGPEAQVTPQPPHEVTDERSVSQPVAATPSQLAKPVEQAPTAHAPAAHTGVALESTQALAHAPQLDTLVSSATSQPLAATPSQSA